LPVERIPNLPENVLGFSAKGTLTASDYENVIIPAVQEHLFRDGKVRFLYHLGEGHRLFHRGDPQS